MDKACKRVLDFITVIQQNQISKLVMKLIPNYFSLLVYSLKLELEFLSRYGLTECNQDDPANQVDLVMKIITNLILSYGNSCYDQIIILLLDLIRINPKISLELISILSKIACLKVDPG
jgi:hypothetical protein